MKKFKLTFLFFIITCGVQKTCFTQEFADKNYYIIDSLNLDKVGENDLEILKSGLLKYHAAKHDTEKIKAILSIIEESWDDNIWPIYNRWLYKHVQQKLKQKITNPPILFFYRKTLGQTLNNMAYNFMNKGKMKLALKTYHQGLKIAEELNNKEEIAAMLSNIALVYRRQEEHQLALDYNKKSIKIYEEIDHKEGLATTYNNLGYVNIDMGNKAEGLENYLKSKQLNEEIGNKYGLATNINNIAGVYENQKNWELALKYYEKSLALNKEIDNKPLLAVTFSNIGEIHYILGNNNLALQNCLAGLSLAEEVGYPEVIAPVSYDLHRIYKKQGKGLKALDMYKLYIQMRDSTNNIETKNAATKQQVKYEYEKQKALDDAENKKKIAIEQQEKEKQQVVSYAIAGGLMLVLAFLGFVFNRLRVTRKQKRIIEEQRDIVEEAHKEITDSINYAERIQRSFLATSELLDEYLNEYFVFFQPKDVVSGDFYWAGKLTNNNFAIVNADSTGHGVPGAIMSILNISSIEKAVEKGITKPAEIFNDTRKTIIERLKKDGSKEGGKDGMDASIISFNADKTIMTYTAAQNPIWIIRENKLIEIKPEKMPIGKHHNDHTPFKGGEFKTQKGDQVYTITDGFQDQFGGPKSKKFMVKKMREYVLSIAHLPLEEQHQKISEAFTNWKGNLEQVDDVCVIGVRI